MLLQKTKFFDFLLVLLIILLLLLSIVSPAFLLGVALLTFFKVSSNKILIPLAVLPLLMIELHGIFYLLGISLMIVLLLFDLLGMYQKRFHF
ncbi:MULTISPECIES: hypothetical protein [Acidianus]|uniref:Uncharacterized protein n=1 Tax=Candidatus Acidianus copahuensis TaxID=1160895 RepID=A0A031LLU9_9CREN|nr:MULTISPECIES: hypothetical protein [Acidianus]EZQ01843.1 hypothetical protein CM19_12140 [Candidatus Acidianus copahuensis]NON63012.1 hypothetical protein [Acidianus sp. RZ1]